MSWVRLINQREVTAVDKITVASGTTLFQEAVESIQMQIHDKLGNPNMKLKSVISKFHHNKKGVYNLWSISKSLSEGWALYGDAEKLQLKKGNTTINFDKLINSKLGHLSGVTIIPNGEEVNEKKKTNVNQRGNVQTWFVIFKRTGLFFACHEFR